MPAKTKEVGVRLSVKDKEVVERAFQSVGKEGEAAFRKIIKAADAPRPSLIALNKTVQDLSVGVQRGNKLVREFGNGAVGALVPILSVTAAVNGAKEALNQFGDIADNAKAAGIDSELFQGIAYQAKLAGVEMTELSGALDIFNKNAGLAAENKGKMVTQLKVLNPELLRNIQLATSQEERIRLAADAIDRAKSSSDKAALATALFGNAGVRLTSVFEGGAAAIDATMEKARALGLIVDRELIDRADELGDEFDTVTQVLDLQFKKVLIELAPLLTGTAMAISGVVSMVRDLFGAIATGVNESMDRLDPKKWPDKELAATIKNTKRMLASSDGLVDRPGTERYLDEMIVEQQRRKTRGGFDPVGKGMGGTFKDLQTQFGSPPASSGSLPIDREGAAKAIKEAETIMQRLRTAAEQYDFTVADLSRRLAAEQITQETFNRGVAEAALKFGDAAEGSDEYARALTALNDAKVTGTLTEREYTKAVEELTERRLIAQNDWLAGIELGLNRLRQSADEVTEDVASAVESWANNLGDQIGAAVRTGKFEWRDLVTSMLADIAKLATQQMITKPLAGLLGSVVGGLFGGGGLSLSRPGSFSIGSMPIYGDGTDFHPGGPAIVGDRGPELLNLPRGSQVIPNHKLSRMGGSSVTLAPTYQINGSGLSEDQLYAVLERNNRNLLSQVSNQVQRDISMGKFG